MASILAQKPGIVEGVLGQKSGGWLAKKAGRHLVTNVAAWFTHGQPGGFLCTGNFSQDAHTKFAHAITNAGNTLTITNVPLDSLSLATWLTYDALFIGDAPIDNGKLTNYVNAGGSVYLYAIGYGSEPGEWNTFLQPFGLAYKYLDLLAGHGQAFAQTAAQCHVQAVGQQMKMCASIRCSSW